MPAFFPPAFNTAAALRDVIAWLASLPLPAATKKQMLIQWRDETNATLTAADYRAAGVEEPPGELPTTPTPQ